MSSRKSVVVIDGHPDPDPGHFCHALSDAYADGARSAGHRVTQIRLASLDFPLLRSAKDFADKPSPPELRKETDAIVSSDHVVIVFPLWLGSMPALLKGFLEQVLHHETAFEKTGPGEFPRGKFTNKSARVIVTMGMPAAFYRFWYMAHGLKSLERNILRFVGFKPVRDTLFGMVDAASDARRKAWLDKVRTLGGRAS